MEEEYRVIEGLENYEVSNLGNVRSIRYNRILNPTPNQNGYVTTRLLNTTTNSYVKERIHRLVAKTFIANPDNKTVVDHIDGNKSNNRVDNLRWCNQVENLRNTAKYRNNASGIKGVSWHKKVNKWCAAIRVDGINVHLGCFDNIEDAKQARKNKVNAVFGPFVHTSEQL